MKQKLEFFRIDDLELLGNDDDVIRPAFQSKDARS